MLLSSILIQLWSSNTDSNQLHLVKNLIDKFIIGLKQLNYTEEFLRFNHHCLVHLYEDRLKHGPLCYVNMYYLEGTLQIFKSFFLSKNMRVATLASKAILDQIINLNDLLEEKENHPNPKGQIATLKSEDNQFLKNLNCKSFYSEVSFLNLKIRYSYSKKEEDSFIKINNNFYKVNLVFKVGDDLKILVKQLIIDNLELQFSNKNFNLNQIKRIVSVSDELKVFSLKKEKIKQCFYALSQNQEFIVDLEF